MNTSTSPTMSQVAALLRSCGLPSEDIEPYFLESFLIHTEEATAVGVVGLQLYGEIGLLRSLAVSPSARGRGIGFQLVQAAEVRARSEGVRKLFLLTNDAAEYFTRFGYAKMDRTAAPEAIRATSQFVSDCCCSATLMCKVLEA